MNCSAALWSSVDPGDAPSVLTPQPTEPTLVDQVDRLLDELSGPLHAGRLSLGANVAMALARTALDAGRSARELQVDLLPLLLSPEAVGRPELVRLTLQMADEVAAGQ